MLIQWTNHPWNYLILVHTVFHLPTAEGVRKEGTGRDETLGMGLLTSLIWSPWEKHYRLSFPVSAEVVLLVSWFKYINWNIIHIFLVLLIFVLLLVVFTLTKISPLFPMGYLFQLLPAKEKYCLGNAYICKGNCAWAFCLSVVVFILTKKFPYFPWVTCSLATSCQSGALSR